MPDPWERPERTTRVAAHRLAARLLAQPWTLASITDAVGSSLGEMHSRTRAALVVRLYALGEDTYPPSDRKIVAFLLRSRFFRPKGQGGGDVFDPPVFAPLLRFAGLGIPALATSGELAAWLALSAEELDWCSGERRGPAGVEAPKLLHYHHLVTRKRDGSPRLLEAPKARLKGIQRRILHEILGPVPVHDSAHGFVAGRSCLTGAQVHASEFVVASFDLLNFFPSIGAPRIHGVFRSLGYPWSVARHLTGLCTTVAPLDVIDRLSVTPSHGAELRAIYRARHLPQGAPTSPALANLLAWRLDQRLHGLAAAAGARYTRYADDLAFSGDAAFARSLGRFSQGVATIAGEEGFCINPAKSRIMPRHGRQCVTGVVVNDHLNVGRAGFDTLRAILHNCAQGDPQAQNRDGVPDFRRHLEGRIAWVAQVNPRRGRALWRAFDEIDWSVPGQA